MQIINYNRNRCTCGVHTQMLATIMKEIHQKYIETFNKVSSQLLVDYGYNYEVTTNGETTRILISKNGLTNHVATFSTNRLDYDHGYRDW